MPEFFNLQQAEKLLPQLDQWLRSAIEARKKIAEMESEYRELLQSLSTSGGRLVDVAYVVRRKEEGAQWSSQLRGAAQEIESSGCILKDLDIGLVDFPCEMDGREVYLCWKLGEPRISFWHDIEEGFAGRKPIDPGMMDQGEGLPRI